MLGNGDGTFGGSTYTNIDPGYYAGGDSYDYNNDGNLDVVTIDGQYTGGAAYFYPGYGDGTFNIGARETMGNVDRYCYGGAAPPRRPLGGCNNLSINIGDDGGTPEMQFKDDFVSEQTIYFSDTFQDSIE